MSSDGGLSISVVGTTLVDDGNFVVNNNNNNKKHTHSHYITRTL